MAGTATSTRIRFSPRFATSRTEVAATQRADRRAESEVVRQRAPVQLDDLIADREPRCLEHRVGRNLTICAGLPASGGAIAAPRSARRRSVSSAAPASVAIESSNDANARRSMRPSRMSRRAHA
jgi:hypothetical protein